jgi:hypothetical protein
MGLFHFKILAIAVKTRLDIGKDLPDNRQVPDSWSFSVSQPLEGKVSIRLSPIMSDVSVVELNGVSYYREGAVKEVVLIAPMKYNVDHFREVDEYVQKGYSTKGACETVADKYGFNMESFRQQYYRRHGNEKWVKP